MNYTRGVYYEEIKKPDVSDKFNHATEDWLVKKYGDELKADVLKIAHHGSAYSSTDEFLDQVRPKIAVITVGENNNYGHPAEVVIEKLRKRDIMVLRTDLDGAVGIIQRKGKVEICTEKHR